MSTIELSAEERDALRDLILDRLSGSDDLGLAITRKDYRMTENLAGIYRDYLTLMLLDLGWGDRSGPVDGLSTPVDILDRVFARVWEAAKDGYWVKDRSAVEAIEGRNRLVLDLCERVLGPSSEPAASM
jgi:hypothetical protein